MPRDGDGESPFDRAAMRQDNRVPFNNDCEQGILGALLIDNRAYERVSDFLRAEHFYAPVHGRIYDAISKLIGRGRVATAVTLKAVFQGDEDLSHLGGAGYLADLCMSVVTAHSVSDYGRMIVELHFRRELITIAEEMVRSARVTDIDQSAFQVMERAEQQIFNLAGTAGAADSGPRHFSSVLGDVITRAQRAYRKEKGARGISTGLTDLNKKLTGLLPAKVYVIAGRPSMGKSSLATNIAFHAAQQYKLTAGQEGCHVLFFSLEMSAEELGHRIVCQQANIDSKKASDGDLNEEEFRKFVMSTQDLASIPLHIDDTPALSTAQVRTRARRQMRQGGLGLIVIDFLQLLRGSGSRQSKDSRVNEVSEITRDLKAISKELGVPVLALSQLSRAVEQRDDKRPQLSDLRESGTIEQDADVIMFVFREEYYLTRDEPTKGPRETGDKFAQRQADWMSDRARTRNLAEIILAKQRGGPVGTVKAHWDGPTTTFSDLNATYSLGPIE